MVQIYKNTFLPNLFYKKRYLLKSSRCNPNASLQEESDFFSKKITIDTISEDVNHFLQEKIRVDVILRRLVCPDIDLFVTFDKRSNQPLGYYWALTASEKSYWHDTFKIPLNSALVFNAYITDNARRKGIYSHLIHTIHQYLLSEKKCVAVYTIVEERNKASLNANLNANLVIHMTNHLIKFFGKNIFSIYKNDKKNIYFVLTGKKNHIP